ncbi:aspartyl/asparaginyl beta-hydroxylase domain-containing protein [Lysobacter sp. HDW10]|uniref:aspartyl/asparaginyl beta-hydroxylase domain-containing protein n=1 Tax=Lysobacter sp. HDW10 TaxID=2714936 RepID=UPI00140AC9FB|nr:aspartyl/asparaginyl beta-hydroxylase domain-containing protein [Lysobacter sp. HDW10]QIK81140.1 aspartyl/asparaginyl beta-hydroxylase domain-containing protein [Lysobacter sp. HDW10]
MSILTPNPRKTHSLRDLGAVDVDALRAAVLAIPESVWDEENAGKPNKFEALDSTRHIVFRFVDSTKDWRASHDRPRWAEFEQLLSPVLAQATRDYGYVRGAFPRVMLARMKPGGVIQTHIDANPAAKWPHKIHVPLQTSPGAVFFVGETGHHLPLDRAVEVNNLGPHGVRNDADIDRIHLIFEYFDLDQPDPAWLEPLLAVDADLRAKAAGQF